MVLCTVPIDFATRNEGAFLSVVRNRRGYAKRCIIRCLPGFMRHVVASYCTATDEEKPIPARYGMARRQELPSGHVLYALAGTIGSGD